jgi:hypothetical protein
MKSMTIDPNSGYVTSMVGPDGKIIQNPYGDPSQAGQMLATAAKRGLSGVGDFFTLLPRYLLNTEDFQRHKAATQAAQALPPAQRDAAMTAALGDVLHGPVSRAADTASEALGFKDYQPTGPGDRMVQSGLAGLMGGAAFGVPAALASGAGSTLQQGAAEAGFGPTGQMAASLAPILALGAPAAVRGVTTVAPLRLYRVGSSPLPNSGAVPA